MQVCKPLFDPLTDPVAEGLLLPLAVERLLVLELGWPELLCHDGVDCEASDWERSRLMERCVSVLEGNDLGHFMSKIDNNSIVLQL